LASKNRGCAAHPRPPAHRAGVGARACAGPHIGSNTRKKREPLLRNGQTESGN
jgi:hypothetical protein